MQVVYEKSVIDKIVDAVAVAEEQNINIDHIGINESEYNSVMKELGRFCRDFRFPKRYCQYAEGDFLGVVCGIKLRKNSKA